MKQLRRESVYQVHAHGVWFQAPSILGVHPLPLRPSIFALQSCLPCAADAQCCRRLDRRMEKKKGELSLAHTMSQASGAGIGHGRRYPADVRSSCQRGCGEHGGGRPRQYRCAGATVKRAKPETVYAFLSVPRRAAEPDVAGADTGTQGSSFAS